MNAVQRFDFHGFRASLMYSF